MVAVVLHLLGLMERPASLGLAVALVVEHSIAGSRQHSSDSHRKQHMDLGHHSIVRIELRNLSPQHRDY